MSMFSIRLKALRKEHGESQEQAASCMDVTRSSYSTYERDINVPPYAKLKKIADHYGVSVEYLMGHTNSKQPKAAEPADDTIIDVYDQMAMMSDLLMDKTSVVRCKGITLTEQHKEALLPYIDGFIKFIDYLYKYIPKGED